MELNVIKAIKILGIILMKCTISSQDKVWSKSLGDSSVSPFDRRGNESKQLGGKFLTTWTPSFASYRPMIASEWISSSSLTLTPVFFSSLKEHSGQDMNWIKLWTTPTFINSRKKHCLLDVLVWVIVCNSIKNLTVISFLSSSNDSRWEAINFIAFFKENILSPISALIAAII